MPVPGLPFTDGQLFQLTNAVLPAWVGLLLFPRFGVPLATAVSCLMSALYIATVIGTFAGGLWLPPPPRQRHWQHWPLRQRSQGPRRRGQDWVPVGCSHQLKAPPFHRHRAGGEPLCPDDKLRRGGQASEHQGGCAARLVSRPYTFKPGEFGIEQARRRSSWLACRWEGAGERVGFGVGGVRVWREGPAVLATRLHRPFPLRRRLHYAAFDVWVGRWEVLDARHRGIPQASLLTLADTLPTVARSAAALVATCAPRPTPLHAGCVAAHAGQGPAPAKLSPVPALGLEQQLFLAVHIATCTLNLENC